MFKNITLGLKLKNLRENKQLSLREVSKMSEEAGDIFYESAISKIERGANITHNTLLRLLHIYNISIEDFYNNDKS